MPSQDTVKWSSLCLLLLSLCLALPVPSPADDGLLQQVDIGLLSIGGRAMYYDPKEGDANWYGGAQVRLHPWHYFAIEGSADYRRNDYAGGTSAHSYPVQVSALIYPLGTTRLAPFILGGGGWYYTTVTGPGGFDNTQNRFGLHAGGGLQFFFNRHFSIDSTYRYIWLEKIESKDQNIVDKKFNDNGHMITIGVNFHF
ncbi:MAG TPA: outer membrane beta-barrel protein [Nitrospira sp.]|jgi:opacity protein-like surface antigen|nr:outer membrane beta-barrel protein [Nitrospira sp.]